MLKLRRGTVVEADPLTVEIGGEHRRAWADTTLVGEIEVGDEVVVNTQSRDLGLGSGGFDIVHANLSRGLRAEDPQGIHVFKLNYTSLQHPIDPVEIEHGDPGLGPKPPAVVISLHGHLAPIAWAAAQARPDLRLGFIQGAGAALPGSLSRDVAELRERGLLCGHVTAGPSYGGEHEAISIVGGLDAAARRLGWEAVVIGPGPGILGSATRLGHGGMAALDAAHAALALGLPTLLSPRLSSSDERDRHRGLSHHTASVLELLLAPVRVPVPEAELEGWPMLSEEAPEGGSAGAALDALIDVCRRGGHDLSVEQIDLDGYAQSGLPSTTMGRSIAEDPLFFAAPLAAGRALAAAIGG
ncbi:MAG: hypothetical protein QOI10_2200 [Solirubrobacterales bacterium]|jgi:hypothetical protein|nr:hypothetical protein [Solirubrobacterales bacterium]